MLKKLTKKMRTTAIPKWWSTRIAIYEKRNGGTVPPFRFLGLREAGEGIVQAAEGFFAAEEAGDLKSTAGGVGLA